MQGSIVSNYGLFIFSLFVSVILVSCGGGSDNSSLPKIADPDYTISGKAFIGNVNSSTISLYSYREDKRSSLITSTTTDEFGLYKLTTNDLNKTMLVCMTGGRFTESFSGSTISLNDTDELCSAFTNIPGTDSIAAITYYGHIAYGLTKYLASNKSETPIKTANETISAWVGFDIIKTLPDDITVIVSDATLTEAYRAGYSNSAISVLASSISKLNNRPPENENTSLEIAYQAHDDIAHDSLLDGQGVKGLAQIESVNFTTKMYRHDNALNILIFANSLRNGTAITPVQLVDTATQYNTNESSIFGSNPIVRFSLDKPSVNPTSVSIKSNTTLAGKKIISADFFDLVGISDIKFEITNANPSLQRGTGIILNDGDLISPKAELLTTNLDDGLNYKITMTATNILGSFLVYPITELVISNVGTKLDSISPRDLPTTPTLVRGQFFITAQASDPVGIKSASLSIDGGTPLFITPTTQLELTNPRFKVDGASITPDGIHIFTIKIVNLGNFEFSHDITYNVDNKPPDTRFIGDLASPTATAFWKVGTYPVTGFSFDENGMRETTMTFNGVQPKTITGNLTNNTMTTNFIVSSTEMEGKKVLMIKGTDNAIGITKDFRDVIVDFTAPGVTQTLKVRKPSSSWAGGNLIRNWVGGAGDVSDRKIKLEFNGSVSDSLSGNKSYQLFIDNTPLSQLITIPTSPGPHYTTFYNTFIPFNYGEGAHTLKVIATDNSGNQNIAAHSVLYFDNTNPTIIIPSPQTNFYTAPATCTLRVEGVNDKGGSGIASIFIDNRSSPIKTGTLQFSMPVAVQVVNNIGDSSNVPATITDNAGNTYTTYGRYTAGCYGTSCRCDIL